MVLVTPLSRLPFSVAACVWVVLALALSLLTLRVARPWVVRLPLLFLFYPLFRAAIYAQASLMWFGLTGLFILAVKSRWRFAAGLLGVILALKPQDGALFTLYAIWLGIRHDRRILWALGGCAAVLIGASLVISPTWPQDWLAQVGVYDSIVEPASLLPWSIVMLIVTWRCPWWIRIAVAQAALFPISDVYSALPLLFYWYSRTPLVALVGAGTSWLWTRWALPKSVGMLVFFVAPLCVAPLMDWLAGWAAVATAEQISPAERSQG